MLKFEDLNPYNGSEAYYVPNEETRRIRDLVKNRHVRRAAGICSGGEMGLTMILPVVREELVLVDHNYRSLSLAMRKYLLLQKHGWRKTQQMLSAHGGQELHDALQGIRQELPPQVAQQFATDHDPFCQHGYDGYYSSGRVWMTHSSIARVWEQLPPSLLARACRKLNKVSFIHGDLSDLIERGPFDLLYVSNALEHTSRHGRSPLVDEVRRIVKPGGFVIGCGGMRGAEHTDGWRLVARQPGSSWTYWLLQTPQPVKTRVRRPVAVAA